MADHQKQIIVPVKGARGLVFISTVILYSLSHDAIGVMDDENFATGLTAQVQISIALMGTVRTLPIEPIELAK